MSEVAAPTQPGAFDDRVDLDPHLSNLEAFQLVGRCLSYLASVRGLFAAKLGFALIALIPGLIGPWTGKILIDQVILQRPFNDDEVPFPPYFQPFVDLQKQLRFRRSPTLAACSSRLYS